MSTTKIKLFYLFKKHEQSSKKLLVNQGNIELFGNI